MKWLQRCHEMARYYWSRAAEAATPGAQDRSRQAASDYHTLTIACDTHATDSNCPLSPDHWLRTRCRRAQTGSCAIVPLADADRPTLVNDAACTTLPGAAEVPPSTTSKMPAVPPVT